MKKLLLSLLLLLPICGIMAQTGSWRAHMAYYDVQQIAKGGHRLYVRASNNLYSYNLNDKSITTYDKIHQLNDAVISMIAWNPTVNKLIIVYDNYNIDLLDSSDDVFNISSYYSKTMTQKKDINHIYFYEQYAYLSTGFGIIKLNMQRNEITETYILERNIKQTAIANKAIYARDHNGVVVVGQLSDNLIDPHNWSVASTVPDGIFNQSTADWDEYHALVETLQPGGPRYNNFGYMCFKHNRLYTVGAGYNCTAELQLPGQVQILNGDEWSFLGENVAKQTGHWFEDVDAVDADPADPNHIFASGKTGLYEFRNGAFVQEFTIDNSPLESALGNAHENAKNYNLIEGILFDSESNLWVVNSGTKNTSLLQLSKSGEWKLYNLSDFFNEGKSLYGMQKMFSDSRGYLWFVNYHWIVPSAYCFNPQSGKLVNKYVNITNQDGITYSTAMPTYIAEDLSHNIWMSTNSGLFMVEEKNVGQGIDNEVTEIKVPRNDGSELADYLLNGVHITSILVDGAGRKWIGTQQNGLYLISKDNMEELQHFTTDNSSILSNKIQSLAMNPQTGELFIGTDVGLCSYMTDATDAVDKMNADDVYAFPNPVPPGYNGLITIRGLSYDADVKILSTGGKLIYQGRSNGGTFTWNGCDSSGRQVASGVYMIATATSEGDKGIVGKVAIIR